jgi:hypothetical protein
MRAQTYNGRRRVIDASWIEKSRHDTAPPGLEIQPASAWRNSLCAVRVGRPRRSPSQTASKHQGKIYLAHMAQLSRAD